jgi:hypothetical protein
MSNQMITFRVYYLHNGQHKQVTIPALSANAAARHLMNCLSGCQIRNVQRMEN